MSYALGQKSLSFCQHVDPRLIAVVQKALSYRVQDGGFACEQSRTLDQEKVLVAQGVSHTLHSHHIIDCMPGWAPPGFSSAVDLVPWNGSAFTWNWTMCYALASAMRRAAVESNIRITWGGCWDKTLNEMGSAPEAPMSGVAIAAESSAYAARQADKGNPHAFLDGPHYQTAS